MTTTPPRLIIHIVGPLLLNDEVFMCRVNNLLQPHCRTATIGTDYQRSVPVRLQHSARLKYAADGDGMPTFSCPVLVLVCLYIVMEARLRGTNCGGDGFLAAELLSCGDRIWSGDSSTIATLHAALCRTSWCPGVVLQHNCRDAAGSQIVVCEHRGNRDLSHLHTHLDPRLYSECVESWDE